MPTYDYECRSCGHTFEVFHGMTESPVLSCPRCRSAVRKLIGGGLGVIFKGSGFYVTDNKGGSSSIGNGKAKEEKRDAGREPASTDTVSMDKTPSEKSAAEKKETRPERKGTEPGCA